MTPEKQNKQLVESGLLRSYPVGINQPCSSTLCVCVCVCVCETHTHTQRERERGMMYRYICERVCRPSTSYTRVHKQRDLPFFVTTSPLKQQNTYTTVVYIRSSLKNKYSTKIATTVCLKYTRSL